MPSTAKMKASAKNRRLWTPKNEQFLKTGSRKKIPAWRIAKQLNRTEGATRQKAFSMGLSLATTADQHRKHRIAA